MGSKGVGALRASTSGELKSLQAMRDAKDRLVTADDMAEFKQTSEMMFDDLRDAFRGHYKYDQNGFGYMDEFSDFVQLSETKGVKGAADEIGFDVPDDLAAELTEYKDLLRSGTTEYFESKPKRVVDLGEFGGAIIPEDTPQETIDLLKRHGMQIETATDEAGRLAARKKFKDTLFQVGGVSTVGAAAMGGSERANAFANNPYQDPALSATLTGQRQAMDNATAMLEGLHGADTISPVGNTAASQWADTLRGVETPLDPLLGQGFLAEGAANYLDRLGEDKTNWQRYKDAVGATLDFL